jgi:PAS domain-containing protein
MGANLDCCRHAPNEQKQMRLSSRSWENAPSPQKPKAAEEARQRRSRPSHQWAPIAHEITESAQNRIAHVARLEQELARRRQWILDRGDPDSGHRASVREEHITELKRIEKELQQQRLRLEAALQHVRTAAASRSSIGQGSSSLERAPDAPVGEGENRGRSCPTSATLEGAASETTGQISTYEIPQFSLIRRDDDRE